MTTKATGVFELPNGPVECEAAVPCLLTDAAAEAGVFLNLACGGKGVCGGCAVDLVAGRFANLSGEEIAIAPGGTRRVLACQTRLLGGAFHLRVPRRSLIEAGEHVVMEFAHAPAVSLGPPVRKEYLELPPPVLRDQRGDIERIIDALEHRGYHRRIIASVHVARAAELAARAGYKLTVTVTGERDGWHIIRLEQGDTTGRLYGAAVDVGTTTVVVLLVDLATGEVVDAASSYNQQILRCDDVASRISAAGDRPAVEELRDLVVDRTVNRLLALLTRRAGLDPGDVAHMTVAGNTVMLHLFCGLSPAGLGAVPFAPVSNFPGPYRAGQLHLVMNPEGFVDVFPSAAAYVGGDTTADMYVCGLQQRSELTVLVDVGTNAEIVVGNHDRVIACAAPAGPAFEGRGLGCGMRAAAGAIDSVRIPDLQARPRYTVLGDAPPAGVCGSGLIDFLAEAFRAGVISSSGRFTAEALARCPQIRTLRQSDAELPAYVLVGAEQTDDRLAPLAVTERDVAALLQAKGVIFAALQIAMKHFGKRFDQIDRFCLAGGFARHIDLDNAVGIGLLPDIDRRKYLFIGNGSVAGAFLALIDEDVRAGLPRLARAPVVVELNLDPQFMDAYTMAMFLPNADPGLFPSVKPKT